MSAVFPASSPRSGPPARQAPAFHGPERSRTRRRGVAAILAEAATLTGRSIRISRRNIDTVMMAVLLPLMLMALFVYVFGGALDPGGDRGAYVNYVVPGIVLLCVGFGAASTAIPVAADLNDGMVERLRSMPIGASAVLTGHVVASLARNGLATGVVVVAAIAMGFRPTASVLEWLALVGLLTLYVLALSWIAAAIGTVARSPESASAAGFFMLFVPYLSSAFVDPDTMPAGLRAVADHQPVSSVIETARGLLTGAAIGDHGWRAVAWSAGLLVAGIAVATMLFARRTGR